MATPLKRGCAALVSFVLAMGCGAPEPGEHQQSFADVRAMLASQPKPCASDNVVLAWNTVAQNSIVTVAAQPIQRAELWVAIMHVAIYDAVNSIGGPNGGYTQFAVTPEKRRPASRAAAAAQAAHDILTHFLPAQQATFDAQLANTLAAVPDGKAETNGRAIGAEVAAGVLAQFDGIIPTVSYTYGPPDCGVYQSTPTNFPPALLPGFAIVKPFSMSSPSQFRPGPPPDLSSDTWMSDYNETKAYGQDTSTVRTPEQTEIGRFYTEHAVAQYQRGFRAFAQAHGFTIGENARFFAMANVAIIDSQIATWDAKYHYSFWRPSTAIRAGGCNPALVADPTWLPLAVTPAHPEYPAAHGSWTNSTAEVLKAWFGTSNVAFMLTSTVTGTTNFYPTTDYLRDQIIDARVYGGMHYRNSGVIGANLGAQVVANLLANKFIFASDTTDNGDGEVVCQSDVIEEVQSFNDRENL